MRSCFFTDGKIILRLIEAYCLFAVMAISNAAEDNRPYFVAREVGRRLPTYR